MLREGALSVTEQTGHVVRPWTSSTFVEVSAGVSQSSIPGHCVHVVLGLSALSLLVTLLGPVSQQVGPVTCRPRVV